MEEVGFVCSIIIFIILCFSQCTGPEFFVSAIMQNMVLVSQAQLFKGVVVEVIVDDSIIKIVGNLGGVMKTCGSTVINVDLATWFQQWTFLQCRQ